MRLTHVLHEVGIPIRDLQLPWNPNSQVQYLPEFRVPLPTNSRILKASTQLVGIALTLSVPVPPPCFEPFLPGDELPADGGSMTVMRIRMFRDTDPHDPDWTYIGRLPPGNIVAWADLP